MEDDDTVLEPVAEVAAQWTYSVSEQGVTLTNGTRSFPFGSDIKRNDAVWLTDVLNAAAYIDTEPRPSSHAPWMRLKQAFDRQP